MRTFQDPDNGYTYVYCPECYVLGEMGKHWNLKHDDGCKYEGH